MISLKEASHLKEASPLKLLVYSISDRRKSQVSESPEFTFSNSQGYSSDPAENNAPFVHCCFVGTLPLREKRSGY